MRSAKFNLNRFSTFFSISLLLLVLSTVSCEKNIDIELDPTEANMVVEATIENDQPPLVLLTTSMDYFSKIDSSALQNAFVRKATVLVSDGTKEVRLVEDSVISREGARIYFYTTSLQDKAFVGKLNNSYTLSINSAGKTYSASTTIPSITRRIDSLWWEKLPLSKDTTAARVIIRATDKPGLGDYIRYFTKVNNGPFLPGFNSVFDDNIIDGSTYTIPIDKGIDKNIPFVDSLSFFKKGDTVTIKLSNIDKTTYDFWRTYEFSLQSIGNPFSSPTRILSNLSNNALGYFGGYANQYRVIILK
jgi:hypothetical protein